MDGRLGPLLDVCCAPFPWPEPYNVYCGSINYRDPDPLQHLKTKAGSSVPWDSWSARGHLDRHGSISPSVPPDSHTSCLLDPPRSGPASGPTERDYCRRPQSGHAPFLGNKMGVTMARFSQKRQQFSAKVLHLPNPTLPFLPRKRRQLCTLVKSKQYICHAYISTPNGPESPRTF